MELQRPLLKASVSPAVSYLASSQGQVSLAVESNMKGTDSTGEMKGRKKMDEYQSVQSLWDPSVGVKVLSDAHPSCVRYFNFKYCVPVIF